MMFPYEQVRREVLVRRQAETSPRFGFRPQERKTREIIEYGIVNIDKPRGPTSHQVSDYVKKILRIGKAGHSGTLDPKVTGLLPVALGRGTRVVQALLSAGKEYVALMHLHSDVPQAKVLDVCNQFIGKITQLPPVKSSVKRQLRARSVYYMDIIEIAERDVLFRVGTQAGTYIRKLIHDIGQRLGTGAHMAELRRTRVGPFTEESVVTLQDLADAYHFFLAEQNDRYLRRVIQPLEHGVAHLPKIWVLDTTVDSICHGASLKVPGISKLDSGIVHGDPVAVMTLKDELVSLAVAQMASRDMLGDRGLAAGAHKVFMLPGTYPRIERVVEHGKS